MPQFMYAESSWLNVELPPLISHVIDNIGVVVQNGYLRIPVVDYNQKFLTYDSDEEKWLTGMLGPVNWSAYGYTMVQDAFYEVPNIFSSPLGVKDGVSVSGPPNLLISDAGLTTTKLFVDVNYINKVWGYNPLADTLYPNAFSGSQFATLMDTYTAFNALSNTVNQSPLVELNSSIVGGLGIMVANGIPDSDLATLSSPVAPTAISNFTASGNPLLAEIPVDSITSGVVLNASDALLTLVANASSVLNAPKDIPGVREYRISLKIAMINASAEPPEPPSLGQPIAAPFAVNVPAGSSIAATVNSIMTETFRPSSKFADGLRKFEDKYPVVYATLKNTAKNPEVQDYVTQAFKGFARKVFSRVKANYPEIADMGSFLGKLDPQSSGTIQTMVSRSQVFSKDTEGKESSSPNRQLVKKLLKHGMTAVKIVGKALLDSSTSTGDASPSKSPVTAIAKDLLNLI
jgi:hypothetical protein